jgi:hypothetical protein
MVLIIGEVSQCMHAMQTYAHPLSSSGSLPSSLARPLRYTREMGTWTGRQAVHST